MSPAPGRKKQSCPKLTLSAVQRSARELSYHAGGIWYVRNLAFKPTGVALGCPLPDEVTTAVLLRVAQTCETLIAELVPEESRRLAYVPNRWYHVTVLNRTHFDADEEIRPISMCEAQRVQEELTEGTPMVVRIHLKGLVMSESGRLIVPGTDLDGNLQTLRDRLASAVPSLHYAYHGSAHVKLAHLLTPLDDRQWTDLRDGLANLGNEIDCRLAFRDIHTPVRKFRL